MKNATKRKRDNAGDDTKWQPYPEIPGYEMSPRNTWDLGARYNDPEDFPESPIVPVIDLPTGAPIQNPVWQSARYHERIVRHKKTGELSRILVDVKPDDRN